VKLTPQQDAFLVACAEPGSLILDSVAGSGKTTTLALGAAKITGTGLATSFSKETALDLGKAMPSNFPASTIHSAGFSAIKQKLGGARLDKEKLYKTVSAITSEYEEGWRLTSDVMRLAEQAQTAGIQPENERTLIQDTMENWEALADQYDLEFDETLLRLARATIIESTRQAFEDHLVSFNEMLTLPLFFPMRIEQFPTVIVDEAQDLSPIQHALLARMLRHNGRVIAAGDKAQAIYAFRGAMSDSYSELVSTFGARELQLSVSFRCPQAVVREAQRFVSHIQWAPSAPEGSVTTHADIALRDLSRTIICRNNAPLTRLALRLIIAGHTAQVAGRDIGAGLKSLTKRVDSRRDSDKTRTPEFLDRLLRWQEKEVQRKPRSKPRIQDKVECLSALAGHHRTLGDLRSHLNRLFVKDTKAEFELRTVHGAKGKEWPDVAILDPHLMPSKWAKQDWEQQQERNLQYVAVTRAKEALHYIYSDQIEAQ
jgi:DNA helicase II / ATP-dependent DNA helicase PcrA